MLPDSEDVLVDWRLGQAAGPAEDWYELHRQLEQHLAPQEKSRLKEMDEGLKEWAHTSVCRGAGVAHKWTKKNSQWVSDELEEEQFLDA